MADIDSNPANSAPQPAPRQLIATSPVQKRTPMEGKVSLRELPWCGKINLRGDPANKGFREAVAGVLGFDLPLAANTTTDGGEVTAFWLGPDEWLLHCAVEAAPNLRTQLASALAGVHHAATEVTDYYSVLELKGADAVDALVRACPLDLHEEVFAAGQCAQTRFGSASVLLYKPATPSVFHLQVRWSFAGYVWDYLARVIPSL